MMSQDLSLSFHLLASPSPHRHLVPVIVSRAEGTYVIRTIDPEFPHQISLARVFGAAKIKVAHGLARFRLAKGIDYSIDLGASGPDMTDIWVDVNRARSLISVLWQNPPKSLIELTSPALDECWSLFDRTRHSILHNWSIASIAPAAYSTSLLLESVFSIDQVTPYTDKSKWIRTGMPGFSEDSHQQDVREREILKWSVISADRFLHGRDAVLPVEAWTLAVNSVLDLLNIPIHSNGKDEDKDMQGVKGDFEINMAASYEALLQHARAHFLAGRLDRAAKPGKLDSPQYQSSMVQTEDPEDEIQVVTKDASCQTDTISTSSRSQLSKWVLIGVVILTSLLLNKIGTWPV